MQHKLKFQPISEFEGDTLYNLLTFSYTGSPLDNDENIKQKWADFDIETYNNLETVDKCVFITELNNKAIGFASYDPRQKPIGIIGHNCIVPKYRGNGYGKQQILEIILILKK
ncbi:MAG: GNAT family N-acetyltransferase [Promethearchaeota archaeon]